MPERNWGREPSGLRGVGVVEREMSMSWIDKPEVPGDCFDLLLPSFHDILVGYACW